MSVLDVFRADAFGVVSLTTSINKLPYKPGRVGQLGVFKKEGITTTTAVVEEQQGKLVLVPSAGRGTMPNVLSGVKRIAKAFPVPYFPLNGAVLADDVQNVRAFGSENAIQSVTQIVNDKLQRMRQSIEVTHEFMRIGALQGNVLDGDGSTVLFNWLTEFGITLKQFTITFATVDDVKLKAHATIRWIQDSLGMDTYDHIHVLCGQTFYDGLTTSAGVKEAYDRFQESAFFREAQVRKTGGFEYAGITWEEYRGTIGATKFIADNEAWAFPVGATDVFQEIYAPAPFIETVNTKGQPIYAKQEKMKFDMGVELHVNSSPLMMCTRPACIVKLTGV